ncbi:MAG TPA: nuclear transport factor 2 family protein [Phnomibacter sp.]|nr:nuclear transport factor 2 family protein [Phnomibacter sp.]
MTIKEIAQDFLKRCAQGNSREAFSLYASREFKHHNAYFKGDGDTLMTAMEEAALQNPNKIFEIKRALQDGEMVAVHSHIRQQPGEAGAAVMHIFRFNNNKIVELWDFAQAVPENMVNENGMF